MLVFYTIAQNVTNLLAWYIYYSVSDVSRSLVCKEIIFKMLPSEG